MAKPNRVATVGQLRGALEGVPDDTPLIVNAEYWMQPEFVDEQVITSTGFGLVDQGDRHGLEPDSVFALNCRVEMDGEHVRRRPIRPAAVGGPGDREPQARAGQPEAEVEAEL
jgi:hypothetical protein